MRLLAVPALAALLIPPASALHAQGDIRLGLGAGVTMPLRAYADLVDKGLAGTASLTFFPGAAAGLGFRLDGIFARSTLSISDGHQTQLGATGNLVFQFGAKRSPNRFYVMGGGGYIRTRSSGPGFGTVSETNPALTAGAGFSFGAKAFGFFVEARYISVYNDGPTKSQFAPLIAGVSFGGL
jgi:hypothetical protein